MYIVSYRDNFIVSNSVGFDSSSGFSSRYVYVTQLKGKVRYLRRWFTHVADRWIKEIK